MEEGAIVVFNVSDLRSDAFLIITEVIHSVGLPLLTSDLVIDFVKDFLDAINEGKLSRMGHATGKINGILEDLWNYGIKP